MNIAVESGIIANGSVDSFINGKNFNKCKRHHPLMVLALEILHFRSFVEQKETTQEVIVPETLRTEPIFLMENYLLVSYSKIMAFLL